MPRRKKLSNNKAKSSKTSVTIPRPEEGTKEGTFLEKLQADLENRQSLISLVLGVLIVVVLGVLLFNYFNRPSSELGPSQQTEGTTQNKIADVKKENLPGEYTVKEGDTLFSIAQSYYDDGYKFPEIAKANNLTDVNMLEVGQVLNIPKLDKPSPSSSDQMLPASPSPSASPEGTLTPDISMDENGKGGQGGAINQTIWGERITTDTYTVVEGDWLSKIAGRAYGDIYAYNKIAQENNIPNPDLIEPGMVLKIPK